MTLFKRNWWLLLLFSLFSLTSIPGHANEAWLHGKWELVYDPDGDKKDWLEFLPDGDVRSKGELGDVEGLYIVTPKGVKAVFTYQDKDFIMTFHYDKDEQALKIVTSHTGRESIYKKVKE
jgi:hypothetical protein